MPPALSSQHHDIMTRSRSPMLSSRGSSPHPTFLLSRHSSPYPSTPGFVPRWYFEEPMHDCPFHIDTCPGCDGTNPEGHSDDELDQQTCSSGLSSLGEDVLSRPRSTTPCSSIRSIHSPEATRIQLKEEFLRLYFPAGISNHETDFMYSKFLSREVLEGSSPVMHAAVDALSLIQVGTAHSDVRLIGQAQSRYKAAVASLNIDLEKPNAMYNDGVLGAIYVLGFCELYKPISQGRQAWRTHHRGLRDLLLNRGTKGTFSRYAQLLVYNFRHVAASVACTERKRVPFSEKAWKRCSALTDSFMTVLSEQVIATPAVLERADQATSRSRLDSHELCSLLLELANMERQTQLWLLNWYSSFECQPYWQEDVAKFRHFQKYSATIPKVFDKVLCFPSFSHASAQVSYWIELLQIRQTMYEINRLFPARVIPKSDAVLIAEADECAEKLCKSVAWLSQPQYGFCGIIRALGPIHFAFKWYSRRMDLQKMAWCDKMCRSFEVGSSVTSRYHTMALTIKTEQPDEDDAEFEVDDDESVPP